VTVAPDTPTEIAAPSSAVWTFPYARVHHVQTRMSTGLDRRSGITERTEASDNEAYRPCTGSRSHGVRNVLSRDRGGLSRAPARACVPDWRSPTPGDAPMVGGYSMNTATGCGDVRGTAHDNTPLCSGARRARWVRVLGFAASVPLSHRGFSAAHGAVSAPDACLRGARNACQSFFSLTVFLALVTSALDGGRSGTLPAAGKTRLLILAPRAPYSSACPGRVDATAMRDLRYLIFRSRRPSRSPGDRGTVMDHEQRLDDYDLRRSSLRRSGFISRTGRAHSSPGLSFLRAAFTY